MRKTPAQRHLEAKQAALASASTPAGSELQGSAYQLMLAQLAEHRRSLKDIQSIEKKIEAKRGFLPLYDDWVDGALAHGRGGQDLVLTTVLIWHIDAGNFRRALQIAEYAVAHSLPLPDQYERTLGTALIDEFGGAALRGQMSRQDALELLPDVLHGTRELDAPDQARAKLHKAYGYALIDKSGSKDVNFEKLELKQVEGALEHLQRAFELFDQVGVKKDIERLDRQLKKLQAQTP